jgi:putative ABC transport system permease protein
MVLTGPAQAPISSASSTRVWFMWADFTFRGVTAMRNWIADLRYGLRGLRRNPGFTLGAILILALGIGANTAIFSIVNAALLRPLPYDEASRLMQVWHVPPAKSFPGLTLFSVSPANYLDWKAQSISFESMSIYGGRDLTFGGTDHPEVVAAAAVPPEFFTVLRTQPLLGRTFTADEDRPGSRVILLGYKFWRDHLGSDPNVVGRDITVDSQQYTVAGVMPEKFLMPDFAKVWVPLAWSDTDRAVRGNHNYLVIARLKPGVHIEQATAELASISSRLEQQYPEDDKGWGATVIPLREQLVGDVRTALFVLLGAVAFVLLIACANVANLVLAKMLGRRRELAIRTALGASRAALLRHVLLETMLLSVLGGALGLLFARFGMGLSIKLLADHLPPFVNVILDTKVLAFTLLLSIAAGVLAGLVPSLRFSRVDANEALKQGTRGTSDSGGKTRNLLVVCEVALSLVLLIGAGLMVRTLWELRNVRPGFDSSNVLTMSVAVPRDRFLSPATQVNFFQETLQRVRALPGVEDAGAIDDLPLGGGGSHQPFSIEGRPLLPMAEQPEVDVRMISPGYLRAMRVPIIRGRDFADSDAAGRPAVAVISAALARRFWPNEDPLGKHLTLTFFPGIVREIVGIVGDVKVDSLNETRPVDTIYVAASQLTPAVGEAFRSFGLTLTVRTKSDPHGAISSVTDAIHQVGPDVPVTDVLSMDDVIAQSMSPQRFNMLLLTAFAGLALLLAAVGIYAVLSYSVRGRVREIGIRMALGASQSDILRLVVGDGMKPILIGVAIGLTAAVALSRFVASLVFGVPPTDPLTFTVVALLLVVVGIVANTLPAYRATRIEPVRTLREE